MQHIRIMQKAKSSTEGWRNHSPNLNSSKHDHPDGVWEFAWCIRILMEMVEADGALDTHKTQRCCMTSTAISRATDKNFKVDTLQPRSVLGTGWCRSSNHKPPLKAKRQHCIQHARQWRTRFLYWTLTTNGLHVVVKKYTDKLNSKELCLVLGVW